MFIIQKWTSSKEALPSAKLYARSTIIRFPMGSAEVKLNEYFVKTMKKSFKQVCLLIWQNLQFSSISDTELLVTLKNKELIPLVQLITYGNRELRGSSILQIALNPLKRGKFYYGM